MDVIELQEQLRKEKSVSVPQLQRRFGLSYAQARQLLEQIVHLNWVGPAEGIHYPVEAERMVYRKLRREEIPDLIRNMNSEAVVALDLIKCEGGATEEMVRKVLDSEVQTAFALSVLLEDELICKQNGKYYARVSRQTVTVLQRVEVQKRRSRRLAGTSAEKLDIEKLKAMFEELFS